MSSRVKSSVPKFVQSMPVFSSVRMLPAWKMGSRPWNQVLQSDRPNRSFSVRRFIWARPTYSPHAALSAETGMASVQRSWPRLMPDPSLKRTP